MTTDKKSAKSKGKASAKAKTPAPPSKKGTKHTAAESAKHQKSTKQTAPASKPVKKTVKKTIAAPPAAEPKMPAPVIVEPTVPVAAEQAVPVAIEQSVPAAEPIPVAEAALPVPPAPAPEEPASVTEQKVSSKKGKKAAPAPPAEAPAVIVQPAPEPVKVPKTVKHLVCLLGDEVLVQEYSSMFQQKGIAVLELKSLSSLKNSAKKITAAFELTLAAGAQKSANLRALDEALPEQVPVATCSVTSTVLMQTHGLKHRHRFVGIAAFPTLTENELMELAPSLHTVKAAADGIAELLGQAKKETAMVQDSVGMVMPRILCQIVNEALFTVQNDVAAPLEIDEAMKHGTNYPHGPIAWGERIGFGNVVTVLDALYEHHHEERYRTAPLLRQMAVAGVFWERGKA
ncbi:MAG: hypothetical protein HUU02_02015 [Bacteroidetes bacterium]|nr:hypothetical protein [Bacteroidota bacterium]